MSNKEVLLQGGVSRGETIQEFRKFCPCYDSIYGFEADDINYEEACKNISSEVATLVEGALCDSNENMSFLSRNKYKNLYCISVY